MPMSADIHWRPDESEGSVINRALEEARLNDMPVLIWPSAKTAEIIIEPADSLKDAMAKLSASKRKNKITGLLVWLAIILMNVGLVALAFA